MDKSRHKDRLIWTGILISLLVFGASSYFAGLKIGGAQTKNIEIKGVRGGENPSDVKTDFSVFWQAWHELKNRHINGSSAEEKNLLEGAIQGLAGSFDDNYTTFFNKEDSKKFAEDVSGLFGGIGAEIGIRNEQLIIVSPLKGSPAEKADLRPKDNILKIDEDATHGITIEEAVKKIRGTPGEKVTLTIFREGWEKSRKIEIVREIIRVPTLDYEFHEDGTLYVRMHSFNDVSEELFAEAIKEGKEKGMSGLILDLRNNPGGYLNVAVRMASWFLNRNEVVVREKYASGEEKNLKSVGNGNLKNLNTVIIINEGSASASEILAGALRDNNKTPIVGMKSYGKGTVQEVINLKDGSTLKITIANWLLPNGKLIDKNGIEPDHKVDIAEEDLKDKKDPQLEKAKEMLKELIKKS